VNVPDAHKIAVVDLNSGQVLANWRAVHLANFPLALGRDSEIVGIIYRIPARLVALEATSGAAKADLPTCDGADDLFFDDKRRRIYVSCGSRAIDVFEQADGRYAASAHIETRPGARTSLFVPAPRSIILRRASRFSRAGRRHPGLSPGAMTTDARGPRRDLLPLPMSRSFMHGTFALAHGTLGSVRNGTRRVEGAKVGSCGMSASGRIDPFAKLSGNDRYLRIALKNSLD
jgi:hypothetical protein